MRRILPACLVVCFLFTSATGNGQQRTRPLSEIGADASRGIAALIVSGQSGIGIPVGSAFFVNDEFLVTTAHVVRDVEKGVGSHRLSVTRPLFDEQTGRITGSEVLEVSESEVADQSDMALLHLKKKPAQRVVPCRLAAGLPHVGSELALSGFGMNGEFPITLTAIMASPDARNFGPNIPETFMRFRNVVGLGSVFVIDRTIPGSFSGAPVYDRHTGVVYGVASGSLGELMDGVGFVHPLQQLLEILDRRGVKYLREDPAL